MERIVTAAMARETDRRSIEEIGIPSLVLMERAAEACAERVREAMAGKSRPNVLVLSGTGNNGADGLAVARMVCEEADTRCLVLGNEEKATAEWKTQRQILSHLPVGFLDAESDWQEALREADVIVDAVFGIGLCRDVTGVFAEVLKLAGGTEAHRISVDIPSGIHTDTGQVCGTAFAAHETVTFGSRKPGHLLYPGRAYAGRVTVRDIGFPGCAYPPSSLSVCRSEDVILPARDPAGNKKTFGTVLLFAGSPGMAGASVFAAKAALAAGTGLVRVLAPEGNRVILQTLVPDAVMSLYGDCPDEPLITALLRWADVVACGPGIGTGEAAERTLEMILKGRPPRLVLDADALNLLARHPEWIPLLTPDTILTPHPGELSRLTGRPVQELLADPIASAGEAARRYGCIVVCKNACTVTALPDGEVFLNETGSDALAKGGSGDVLAGLMAGLLAAGLTARDAAVFSVRLHGEAGEKAGEEIGARACGPLDVIRELSYILKNDRR